MSEILSTIKHNYGAVGAARKADDVNPLRKSNGSQFYIVQDANGEHGLDNKYTVFGIVIDGMTAVDAIAQVPVNSTTSKPLTDVVMKDVELKELTTPELKTLYGFDIPE